MKILPISQKRFSQLNKKNSNSISPKNSVSFNSAPSVPKGMINVPRNVLYSLLEIFEGATDCFHKELNHFEQQEFFDNVVLKAGEKIGKTIAPEAKNIALPGHSTLIAKTDQSWIEAYTPESGIFVFEEETPQKHLLNSLTIHLKEKVFTLISDFPNKPEVRTFIF